MVSVHSVGLPLLLVPAALVSTDPGVMRLEMVVIAALLALLIMRLLERVPYGTPAMRWLAWAAVVLSAPMVVYASRIFSEIPAALLTVAAILCLLRARPGPWALAGATTAAALLPWLNLRFAPIALVLVLAAAYRAWPDVRRAATVAALIAPLVVSAVLLAWGFHHWYGSISPSAQYAFADSSRTLSGAYRYLFGGFFSPRYGWLPQAPVAILAVAGVGLAVIKLGRPALIGSLGAAFYLVLIAVSGVGFPGISFAARLQVVVMPLAAVPLLVVLATRPRWRWPFGALLALSLVLTAYVTAKPTPSAAWSEPGTTLARTHYSSLWPDYTIDESIDSQIAQPADQTRTVGRLTTTPPLPTASPAVTVVGAGRAGVVARATTTALPRRGYVAAAVLRADTTGSAPAATVTAYDDRGKQLNAWTVPASAIPPADGYRALTMGFALDHTSTITLEVRTTGAVGLRVGGLQVVSSGGSSQAAAPGFPGVGLTVVWTLILVGLGVALAVEGRGWRAVRRRGACRVDAA